MKVNALNIRGNGNTDVYHQDNKWYELWGEEKIRALIVGETHMNDERKTAIDHPFG